MKTFSEKNNIFNNYNYLGIKFNDYRDKKNYHKIKESKLNNLGIIDFTKSLDIDESEYNLITSKKIKNKKELYTLTDKENEILKKTIELNKIGVYNNLRVVSKNGDLLLECLSDISKNTLITIIGGSIYFSKNHKNINLGKESKMKNFVSLVYFKTAKSDYDRYIKVSKNSIVNSLFPKSKNEPNLDAIKIVDDKDIIRLIIVSNKDIKKGEILSLDRELLVK